MSDKDPRQKWTAHPPRVRSKGPDPNNADAISLTEVEAEKDSGHRR